MLRFADLSDNRLASIHGLQSCTKLLTLDLSENRLARLAGLEGCHHLQKLMMDGNLIINSKVSVKKSFFSNAMQYYCTLYNGRTVKVFCNTNVIVPACRVLSSVPPPAMAELLSEPPPSGGGGWRGAHSCNISTWHRTIYNR